MRFFLPAVFSRNRVVLSAAVTVAAGVLAVAALHVPAIAVIVGGQVSGGTAIAQAQSATDDTFACLDTFKGPIVNLSGNHGYNTYSDYVKSNLAPETRYDAHNAVWRQEMVPEVKSPRDGVVMIGSASVTGNRSGVPVCFAGGTFIGTNDPNTTWSAIKGPRGQALMIQGDRHIVDGIRVHNVGEDGISPRIARNDKKVTSYHRYTVRNSWFSHIFDDAIEETQMQSILIEDTLFDGVMQAIAVDPGSNNSTTEFKDNRVTINGVLIRTTPIRHSNSNNDYLHGFGIKTGSAPRSYEIHNSVFAWSDDEQPLRHSMATGPARWMSWTTSCSNNVILWMSNNPWPPRTDSGGNGWNARGAQEALDDVNKRFPGCFKVITGQEARNFWEAAKTNWINCHPKVGRVPGDPQSDFSKCDPNTYGGGGSATPSGETGTGTTQPPAPQACHLLTSANPVPAGFGAAYDALSPARELLLRAACDGAGATVTVGGGLPTQYVHRRGYEWRDNQWRPIELEGDERAGDWYVGSAQAALPRTPTELRDPNHVVAYVCTWTGAEWRCGCRDQACAASHWQLQRFQQPLPPSPPGLPSAPGGG